MNQEEFYKRVSGILSHEQLQKKTVAVIGLGSGGCRVAAELGRLGIRLLLFERPEERLEEHNIVRHLLGYRSLGKLKLSEMERYLRNMNPSVQLDLFSLDVVKDNARFAAAIADGKPDVIAICTDNEPSKHAVNEIALRLGIPQTGGAVYDGGIGGEVYRVRPGEACYGCLAARLQIQQRTRTEERIRDYNSSEPGEVPGSCALNLDIAQIAILQSRFTLDLLLEPGNDFFGLPAQINVCVFANRLVPGTFPRPLHAQFFSLLKQTDCLACGTSSEDIEIAAGKILETLEAPAGEAHREASARA